MRVKIVIKHGVISRHCLQKNKISVFGEVFVNLHYHTLSEFLSLVTLQGSVSVHVR